MNQRGKLNFCTKEIFVSDNDTMLLKFRPLLEYLSIEVPYYYKTKTEVRKKSKYYAVTYVHKTQIRVTAIDDSLN